jgi:hypothetical protein
MNKTLTLILLLTLASPAPNLLLDDWPTGKGYDLKFLVRPSQ